MTNTFSKKGFLLLFIIIIGITLFKCTSSKNLKEKNGTELIINADDEQRQEIINYAKKFIGTKYKYAGKNPKGFDCSGFTYYIMKQFEKKLPVSSSAQAGQGKKVSFKNAKPADLIFFKRTKTGRVFHVALIVSNDDEGIKVIHSTSSRGVVVDNISTNSWWRKKYKFARDILTDTE